MQDLLLILACVLILSAGFLAPFIMSLAYVWVDIFTPQLISNGLLGGMPVALIFGALAVITYITKDRRDPPKFNVVLGLQIALAIWICLTTTWARNPAQAYDKWNTVIKVVVFASFIPYAIRTRVHIEAFVLVYLFSICAHIIPWGVKTFLSGGGYGLSLGLLRSNSAMLAESSTVSTVGVMIAPLILAMRKNTILLPQGRLRTIGAIVLIMLGLVASIGTFARTGLVAIAVSGGAMWLRARQKVLFTIMALIMGGVMFSVTSDKWTERISTVKDYQSESSAAARLAVWKWTWSFAQSNPFGGGFLAYIGNQIVLPTEEGQPPEVQNSRAYHNMFFSVLGDHGYPGIALYVGVLVSALMAFRKARKLTAKLEEHVWCADLAQAGQVALVTMMAGGMFVEIDWTPLVWYIVSLSVCLQQYAIRVAVPARSYLNLPTTSSLDPLRMPIPVSGPIPGSVKVPPLAARRGSAPVMRRTSL